MSLKSFSLQLSFLLIANHAALGAKSPATTAKPAEEFPTVENAPIDWPQTQDIAELKERAKKLDSRAPAANGISERDIPGLKDFRNEFLNFKKLHPKDVAYSDALESALADWNKNYDSYPVEAQYVIAQLSVIRAFRGFLPRFKPLEDSAHKIAGAYVLKMLRESSSLISSLLPSSETLLPDGDPQHFANDMWRGLMEYTSVPSPKNPRDFENVSELQNYLTSFLKKELDLAGTRLAAIGKTHKEAFYFDKLFLYGTRNIVDDVDQYHYRFRQIGPAEISGNLAAIHMALHDLFVFSAYNLDNAITVQKSLVDLLQIGSGIKGFIDGSSPKQRKFVITKFPKYLTIRGKDEAAKWGSFVMKKALIELQRSVTCLQVAWGTLPAQRDNDYSLLRASVLLPYSVAIDLKLKTMRALVDHDHTPVKSFLSGEEVVVNLPSLYNSAPEVLQSFLANGFEPGKDELTSPTGKKYTNYLQGRPIAWDLTPFKPYFDIPSDAKADYPLKIARVLRQGWTGLELSSAMMMLVK